MRRRPRPGAKAGGAAQRPGLGARALPAALGAVAALAACVTSHRPAWPEPAAPYESAPRPAAAPRTPPPPRPGPREIAVDLDSLDGRTSLRLSAGGAPLEARAAGGEVTLSDGRRGPWLELPADGLEVEGRRYPGRIVLLPRPQGGVAARNLAPVEEYVRGVVAAELAIWSAPSALLEAQAVAARSYALAQVRGRPGLPPREVLSDTTRDQAYRGEYVPGPGAAAQAVDRRLREAVERTRGVVLTLHGRVLDARFHAACGGHTAAFADAFEEPDPGGMEPVECAPCRDRTERGETWEWTASAEELAALAVDLRVGRRLVRLLPLRTDEHGRWVELRALGDAGGANLGATELRRRLGFTRLKSAAIARVDPPAGSPVAAGMRFAGRGRGHGVGLCQTGARDLADEGWSAARILRHYFPGATLARLLESAP